MSAPAATAAMNQQQLFSMFHNMDPTTRKQLLQQTLGDPRAKERRVLAPLPRQSGGSIHIARHPGILPIGHHRQGFASGFANDREVGMNDAAHREIAPFAADTIFSGELSRHGHPGGLPPPQSERGSWPPSPMTMPPMPTFLDDLPQRNMHAPMFEDNRRMSHPIRFDFSAESVAPGQNIWGADGHRFASEQHPVKRARTGTSGAIAPLAQDSHGSHHASAPAFEMIPVVPVNNVDMDARFKELVPSPSALAKLASEHSRSVAATYLSDWFADAIWEASSPLLDVSVSPYRRSLDSLGSASAVPPPFRRFVQQTVYQVSASAGSVLLALYYVHKLPIGTVAQGACDKDRAFRDDLFGLTGTASRSQIPWRLLVLGLTLANKWMEDNTFTTKTWHEVTGLSISSMRSLEMKAIAIFDWALGPRPDAWQQWLQQLRLRETNRLYGFDSSSPRRSSIGTIGSERKAGLTSVSTRSALRVIDELISEVRHTRVSFDPVFPSSCLSGAIANADTPTSQPDEFPTPPPSYSAHEFDGSNAAEWECSRSMAIDGFTGSSKAYNNFQQPVRRPSIQQSGQQLDHQSGMQALGLSLGNNANQGMESTVHADPALAFRTSSWLRNRSVDTTKHMSSVWPSAMPVF